MINILKRILFLILIATLTSSFAINSYADCNENRWYIKRNGNNCPYFPKEAEEITKYSAYYVDILASNNEDPVLYLTFDAGYENGNVERILDALKEESVPGAFFVLDNIILKNTDLVKRMDSEGHLICNHTKNHKNLSCATEETIAKDLRDLEDILEANTGIKMAKYFRFPEGKYSINALKAVEKLGYKTIFWSFAYDDWDNNRQMNSEKAIKKILDNTHNGAVILLHPTSKTNADILPVLIKEWKRMGYRFGTLEELTN